MGYGMYGRGYGRGRGRGLDPSLSAYCRWFPSMPRGFGVNAASTSGMTASPVNMVVQPSFGMIPHQIPSYSIPYGYPQQPTMLPPAMPQQFQPTILPPQPQYASQVQYGLGAGRGMGMGLGGGLGMGMRYSRRMGQFGGAYQY